MQISAFLKKSTPSILSLSGWLILASLAFETRWKRNEITELLKTRNQKIKSQESKNHIQSSVQNIDYNDNKSIII
jgi:uncharacterized membrane protein affecting hemolysin expression